MESSFSEIPILEENLKNLSDRAFWLLKIQPLMRLFFS